MSQAELQANHEVLNVTGLELNGTSIGIHRDLKPGDIDGRFEKTVYFVTPPISQDERAQLERSEMSRSVPSLVGRLLKLDHHTLRDTTSFTRKGQINPEDREAGIELASRLIELRGQPIARVTSRLMEQVEDVTLVVAK